MNNNSDILAAERERLAQELRADGFKPIEDWHPFWRYFATALFIGGFSAGVKGAIITGSPLGFIGGFVFVMPLAALIAGAMALFDRKFPQPRPLWLSIAFPVVLCSIFFLLWIAFILIAMRGLI